MYHSIDPESWLHVGKDFCTAEPKRSKSRSDFQENEGPSTLGRIFIDVSLSFDRLAFNLSGILGELFEHFESAVTHSLNI